MTQSTPTQKTTQDPELSRVLGNPDNFLVSAGFEDVFEELTSPDPILADLIAISHGGNAVLGALSRLSVTDRVLKVKLLIPGKDMTRWIDSHKSINSQCTVTSGNYSCHGFINSISCKPHSDEYHSVKYTILIDKNT